MFSTSNEDGCGGDLVLLEYRPKRHNDSGQHHNRGFVVQAVDQASDVHQILHRGGTALTFRIEYIEG
jgi:hypothetical protein